MANRINRGDNDIGTAHGRRVDFHRGHLGLPWYPVTGWQIHIVVQEISLDL